MWNHLAHDSTVPGSARWALLRGATTVSGRKDTRLGGVIVGLGRGEEFSAYLVALRKAHRPKRNFMAALSADGL
jgi:hypothetical protein